MLSTVTPDAKARLAAFVAELPAATEAVAGPIARVLSGPPRWMFVSLPTGSGKTLYLSSRCLASDAVGETWCTEPTITSAMAIYRTLASTLGQHAHSVAWVGYGAGGEAAYTPRTRLKIMTTGHCITHLVRLIAAGGRGSVPAHIVLDEMHHPSSENWVAFQLAKHLTLTLKVPIHVTVASATLNRAQLGMDDFAGAVTVEQQDADPGGRRHAITEHFDRGDPSYPAAVQLCHSMALNALRRHSGSSGIVFLAGEDCVHSMCARLAGCAPDVEVVGVWSGMPSEVLGLVTAPPPEGKRRIYVCTNVAETGITLPDADWVCDSGYRKAVVASSTPGAQALLLCRTTAANAKQRAGRVGRCRPGHVYRAYGAELVLEDHAAYEFEVTPPYGHCLRLIGAGLDVGILGMPPERQAAIVDELIQMNMLTDARTVTPLGRRATAVPVAVPHAAALIAAAEALPPGPELLAACLFVAIAETGNLSRLFWVPSDARRGREYEAYFDDHFGQWVCRDDLEALVRLLWEVPRGKGARKWCREHSLNDCVVRAILTLADTLVYHAFYCAWGSVPGVWAEHARADAVDYDALRQWAFDSFGARVLRFKGEDARGNLFFADARDKLWTLDSKRRLFNFHHDTVPTTVAAMTLFECDTARGTKVALASCIVSPPLTPS